MKLSYRFLSKNSIYLVAAGAIITGCSDIQGKNRKNADVKGFTTNIEKISDENKDFRRVLYTARHSQLVVMNLKPGEEIGEEIHKNIDQFFRVEEGKGKCIINDYEYEIKAGDAIVVPSGSRHNVINLGNEDMKIYTIYSPPRHKDGTLQETKEDAQVSKEKFDGITSEG